MEFAYVGAFMMTIIIPCSHKNVLYMISTVHDLKSRVNMYIVNLLLFLIFKLTPYFWLIIAVQMYITTQKQKTKKTLDPG